MPVMAFSISARVGVELLAPLAPVSPSSCIQRSLSPRCALGRRESMTWFLMTVVPGDILSSTRCASCRARFTSSGWAPSVHATHPSVARRCATVSRPSSSCPIKPLLPSKTSASLCGIRFMRSRPSLVGRRRSLLARLSTMGCGGTHLPSRRDSRTASTRTTVPVCSCLTTSAGLRSMATRSSSSFSFCFCTSSPSCMCST
mmetsp:Transcript_89905/g.290930  ORF Transcript_89905/g.290930 Transcript_89905/m.290930 type:complete len:201 (+) Transcript_89905:1-603(+)